ncbi:unnamed protein product [Calypogeia fissa]
MELLRAGEREDPLRASANNNNTNPQPCPPATTPAQRAPSLHPSSAALRRSPESDGTSPAGYYLLLEATSPTPPPAQAPGSNSTPDSCVLPRLSFRVQLSWSLALLRLSPHNYAPRPPTPISTRPNRTPLLAASRRQSVRTGAGLSDRPRGIPSLSRSLEQMREHRLPLDAYLTGDLRYASGFFCLFVFPPQTGPVPCPQRRAWPPLGGSSARLALLYAPIPGGTADRMQAATTPHRKRPLCGTSSFSFSIITK